MSTNFKLSSFKIILTFVCLALVGIAFIPKLAVKLAPSKALPQLNISFYMPGMAPIVVETEVTSKLESILNRIRGVNKISSSSGNGWGEITMELDKKVNLEEARFECATVLRQAWSQLPIGVSYPTISLNRPENEAARPFLSYTVIASDLSIDIQQYVEKRIKPYLAQIEGIYSVDVSGANAMEWQLEYDYNQLKSLNVTTDDIQAAIYQSLRNEALGMTKICSSKEREKRVGVMLLPIISEKITKADLQEIEIKKIEDRVILLKNLVKIKRVESPPSGYYRINGNNTIYFSLIAEETANQLELVKRIRNKISEIEAGLPEKYEIQLAYDATEYLERELEKIYYRSGFTLFILLLFVFIIYRNLKYTFLILCSLFINIAIAVIFYYLFALEIQLYSLAGITISLTLLIDNVIVMADQIIRQKNKKAFLAILAATITTISSLVIIFFLEEKIRMNLQDFAWVIILNLFVSVTVALFLVPALIEKMNITGNKNHLSIHWNPLKKIIPHYHKNSVWIYVNNVYIYFISFLWKRRFIVFFILILSFGLPVFLLPDKMEGESNFSRLYNKTIGTTIYKEEIKPYVDIFIGGSLRLFAEKVYKRSYWTNKGEETSLYVNATLPQGSTIIQMNYLIEQMETYISQFPEVKQFETNISNANRASINIRFEKLYQKGGFPYLLKSRLIDKSLQIGGGSWTVFGVGDGFSNDIRDRAGDFMVEIFGFNYDDLCRFAEILGNRLSENGRVKDVNIASQFSWYKEDYQEFRFDINHEVFAKEGIQPYQLYNAVKPFFEKRIYSGRIIYAENNEQLVLSSKQSEEYRIWDLEHIPLYIGEKQFKLSELATISKHQIPQRIRKENQQYRLCIQYEYIGVYEQGQRFLDKQIQTMRDDLPIGYTIKKLNTLLEKKEKAIIANIGYLPLSLSSSISVPASSLTPLNNLSISFLSFRSLLSAYSLLSTYSN